MSYLLDSVPNQMLQQRKLKREKKQRQDRDQPLEEHVKVPLCDKTYDHVDQGESGGKRCYSPELVLKKQAVKCKRFGETNKLVSEQPYSKLRQENSAGGAVKVQGSRVVQLIGQKERHNKVSTTRGPRDRRVRLAAHTAIQFYDVQDRLGYDQPSKAIDWLIEKAKAAIEALEELSSQNHESVGTNNNSVTQTELELREERTYQLQHCQGCDMGNQHPLNKTSMNNESIFSVVAATQPCSSQFQDYLTEKNLQCSKAPDFDFLYSSAIDFAEDELNSAAILSELNSTDMGGRFQSLTALNSCSVNGGEEFVQNSLPTLLQQPLLCENQVYSQWGPLQSSNLFSVHSSTTPPICVNGHAHMQSSNSHLFSTKGFSSGGFFGI